MWRLLLALVLCLPVQVSAAVTISEIAWMGSSVSANHEWIELHNTGSAVDVTGWTIEDGMNLNIELAGTIPAGAYAVLERTSDESVAGKAFQIYTGSLVNTGATLTLRRLDGGIEDRVAGGEGWESIGGDNATKETAQYSSSGWFTSVASPGTENQFVATSEESVEEVKREGSAQSRPRPEESSSITLELPDVSLQLVIDAPEQGYVNQLIAFDVTPSGIGKTLTDSLHYEWNFGDTNDSREKSPTHRFAYPGTYVVTLYASYKRQEQVARHEITILPTSFSLTLNQGGDVQVNNDSPYEIDFSRYRLVGEKEVVFPDRSIILPNQTVTIDAARIGSTNERMLALYDELGNMVASRIPEVVKNATTQTSFQISPTPQISAAAVSRPVAVASPKTVEQNNASAGAFRQKVAAVANADEGNGSLLNSRQSYTMLVVMLLLITLGIYLSPRRN